MVCWESASKFIPLINLIAIYYQIRDDYMNLQSQEVHDPLSFNLPSRLFIDCNYFLKYESKKGFADDLTEGKFSFPIIHAIQSDTDNALLLSELGYAF